MGIDGIGGGGPPGGVGGPGGPTGPRRGGATAGTFRVGEAPSPDATGASEALDRLSAGAITLDQYLDVRVDDALRHLQPVLPPDQLDFVRSELRQQLADDPVLVELVRRLAGTSAANES